MMQAKAGVHKSDSWLLFVDDDGSFAIRGAIFCPPLTPEEVPSG